MYEVAPSSQQAGPGYEVAAASSNNKGFKQNLLPIQTPSYGTDLQNYALPFDSNVENYIATNQSKWGLLGKAVGQTASEAVLGTIEGASYLLDWQQAIDKLGGDEQEYTNWLADAMKEAKGKVSEDLLKVYQTSDAQEGFAPGDATWWAKNTPSTIGTALSLMVPAAGLAGLASKGAKLLGASAATARTAATSAATFGSRYAESTMEANQVFERTYNDLKAKNPAANEEDLRMAAGEAASKTWNTNWVFSAMDFLQYNSLLKGFNSLAKGKIGRSIGEIAGTMASEAAEEAGQFITAEEAYSSATAETDFFGKGFGKRLGDYVKNPEFQASAFLGAIGGAVFAGAGVAAEKMQPKVSDAIKAEIQNIVQSGMQKENANYVSDTGTSQGLDSITYAKMAFKHLAKGSLPQYKAELETLEKKPDTPAEARANIRNFVEDTQFLQDEQAKLKNSAMPAELHLPILDTKLTQRHMSRLSDNLTREINDVKQEVIKNKELANAVVPLKDLQLTTYGYQELSKTQPQFKPKAEEAFKALVEQAEMSFPGQDVQTLLHTSRDQDLFKKAFQLASTNEQIENLKKELASLSTPEGVAAYKQKTIDKNILTKSKTVKTPAELEALKKQTTTPEVLEHLDKGIKALQQAKAGENKAEAKAAANEAIDQMQQDSLEQQHEIAVDTEGAYDVNTDDVDTDAINDISYLTENNEPDAEGIINGLTREETARMFGPEVAAKMFERLDKESEKEDKAPTQTKKQDDTVAKKVFTAVNKASVFLKELAGKWTANGFEVQRDATGAAVKQSWYDKDGKEVSVLEVFATDGKGNLLINTPLIQAGMKVTLKVENTFPFTLTEGFRPDNPDNFVINAYVAGHEKPVFQLPSASNTHLDQTNPVNSAMVKQLRDLTMATGTLETSIVDKSLGDTKRANPLNSLEVLSSDYYQNAQGQWVLGKLPHNPILGIYIAGLQLGEPGQMRGMSNKELDRLKSLDESVFSKQPKPGQTVVLRTNSKGELKVVPLDNRALTDAERTWAKNNMVTFISEGQIEKLREVLNVQEKGVGVLKKGEIAKLKKDKFYFINFKGAEENEILIPYKNGWARVTTKQLDSIIKKEPVSGIRLLDNKGNTFKGAHAKDRYNITPTEEGGLRVYEAIDNILNKSFKNVKKSNINSEVPYIDPVTGTQYNSFYDYVVATNTLTTDLIGDVTTPGFSVHNATVYLDPNPNQVKIEEVGPNELVIENTPPVPLPANKEKSTKKRDIRDLYGKLRAVSVEGFEVMTQKELDWFKRVIGDEYLETAKGVDRIIANGGVEAFGMYHNAMVTLAEYGETGTAYHEAFHFVVDQLLTPAQKEKLLNEASKHYGIERSHDDKLDNTVERLRAARLSPEEYFKKRYNPETRYTGPRDTDKWLVDLQQLKTRLSNLYASKYVPLQELASDNYDLIDSPGEVIPITIRFLDNIKKNQQHSTTLDKPFSFKDATPKENEVLTRFYGVVKAELEEYSKNTGKPQPRAISNERLVEKLSEWLNKNYGIQTYKVPETSRPYGISGILPSHVFGQYDPIVSGGEVFVSDGLHFPDIASGHNKQLTNKTRSNTLGWFIETKIHNPETKKDDLFLYEFQSDILPEIASGDFKFTVDKVDDNGEANYVISFRGNTLHVSTKDLQTTKIKDFIERQLSNAAKEFTHGKLAAEKAIREGAPKQTATQHQLAAALLVTTKKLSFLDKIVTEESTSSNFLYLLEKKMGKTFEAIMDQVQHLRKTNYKSENDPSEVADSEYEYQGYVFSRIQVDTHLKSLIEQGKIYRKDLTFGKRKPLFKEKPSIKDYHKKVKALDQAQGKYKYSQGLKEEFKKENKEYIDNYYQAREKAINEFFEAEIFNAVGKDIDKIVDKLQQDIFWNIVNEQEEEMRFLQEQEREEQVEPTPKKALTIDTKELQKSYEHWYKVMFEKFIKIALKRAKDQGHNEVYLPTYASMKAIEGSKSTGRIYTAPQENRDEKFIEDAETNKKFELGVAKYRNARVGVDPNSDSATMTAYYVKDGTLDEVRITKEEYDKALQQAAKQAKVGPFYAALSKVKGVNVVGLETPSWSTRPLLKVTLEGYNPTAIERFKAVPGETNEEKAYKNLTNDQRIEEKLAEDFRAYMLSDGKVKPKGKEVKGFFAKIWKAIKDLLGLKGPIERMFKNIATGRFTPAQRARIGTVLKDRDQSHRLLPGVVDSRQQKDIIDAISQEVVTLANQLAVQENKEFEDLFTEQGRIDKLFNTVKDRYLADYNRIISTPEDQRVDQDEYRRQTYIIMGITDAASVPMEETDLLGQWDDISTPLQVETGFKTEVLKNFAKWGFTVKLKDGTEYSVNEDDNSVLEDEIIEIKKADNDERVFDLDHTLVSPIKSMSQRIKSFLSMIPEPETTDKGQIVYNEDGTQKTKTTILGAPRMIDFRKAFRNLTSKLADSGAPLTKLEELAKNDPISKAIFDALSAEVAKGNRRLLAEFNTKLNLVRYPYVTFMHGYDKKGGFYSKVIHTDRNDMQRTIINRWEEVATQRNFIKTDRSVVKPKAEALLNRLKTLAKAVTATTQYEALEKEFKDLLAEIGVVPSPQTWAELKAKRGAPKIIRQMMFEPKSSSLYDFLKESLSSEKDPFDNLSKQSVLNRLAYIEKNYIDDIRADVFLNEAGNQVNSINSPSWIAELVNKIHNYGQETADFYLQDKFYEDNEFIKLWRGKTANAINFFLPSALRLDEGNAKEFGDRTPTDSYIMRLIGFHNTGNNQAYISTGTLSDKSKQIFITLPKKDIQFLKQVLRNTALAEARRIQRVKQGIGVDLDVYNVRGKTFVYMPELNDIQGLADSLTEGEISVDDLNKVDSELNKAIDKHIQDNYDLFVESLIEEGVVERDKGGNLVNKVIPADILGAKSLDNTLKEFFYNDYAWRTEMSKVLHGDMALYKDEDAYYKRGYQVVTPGLVAWSDPTSPTNLVRAIYAGTRKVNSDTYLDGLARLMGNDAEAKKIAEVYRKGVDGKGVNKTDAQSLCTVTAWKKIAEAIGIWSKDHQEVYDFAWGQGLTITKAIEKNGYNPEQATRIRQLAAKIVLQPWKPFQISDRVLDTPSGKLIVKEQFKDSITPLIPDFAKKHNNGSGGYADMLAYMEQHGIDIMSADDAVKVGKYGVINDFTTQPTKDQTRVVPLADIRFPQVIPEKVKDEITMLTQFWKLLPGNVDPKTKYNVDGKSMTGQEVINSLNDLWTNRISESSKKLQDKLGLGEDFKLSDDKNKRKDQLFKLKTLLQAELMSRDLNDNYADSIQLILRNIDRPEFTLQLGFPMLGRKFLSVLTNLFKKNILKQKEPGYSMVNLADFGVSTKEHNSNLNFITNDKGELVEAEIGMPIEFFSKIKLNWIEDVDSVTGKIRWEQLNQQQKDALQMIMVRIPTSNKSSMLPVRVVMVLPKAAGSVIMVPGEGTTQMGFDFDVDKTSLIKRVLNKEGQIDIEDVDTKLFNLAWSILTNTAHTKELLTPLAAPTLEEKVKHYQTLPDPLKPGETLIPTKNKSATLSPATDLRMEKQNKQAKLGIGIASRWNTGFAMMQHLLEYVSVPDVKITVGGFKFKLGGQDGKYDNEGNLISNNHAQLQHAELDGAKDPLLAKLNVPPVLLPVAGYLTNMGLSLPLTMDFLNQPVIREWLRMYNISGGTNTYTATTDLLAKYPGISAQIDMRKQANLLGRMTLSDEDLAVGLTSTIADNLADQTTVFLEFQNYFDNARTMGEINTVLSIDTFQDMTGIEAIESFAAKVTKVTDPDSPVRISPAIFKLDEAPPQAKRLAAFYKYALRNSINFTSQFYPYFSTAYKEIKNSYAKATGTLNLTDKDTLVRLNQFIDFYVLEGKNLLRPVLDKVSPNYTSRWSFFSQDKSLWKNIQSLVKKYPALASNELIKNIENLPTHSKDGLPMIGVRNTNSNIDKNLMIAGWHDMMMAQTEEIRHLAGDLVRFAIYSSGFGYNTKSFIDLVPVQFWVENGIAENHRVALEGLLPDEDGNTATQMNASAVVRSFIRHNFATLDMPEGRYYENSDNEVTTNMKNVKRAFPTRQQLASFTINSNDRMFFGRNRGIAQFIKVWDFSDNKYRLYEAAPGNYKPNEDIAFKEVQPLGVPVIGDEGFVEVSPSGDNKTMVKHRADGGKPSPWNTPEPTAVKAMGLLADGTIAHNKYVADYVPGGKTTPEIVLQRILERETDVQSKKLAEVMMANADKINTEVMTGNPIDKETGKMQAGRYTVYEGGRTEIILSTEANIKSDQAQRYVALHELTHAFMAGVIANPKTEQERAFVRNMTRLWEKAKSLDPNNKNIYNLQEFVAELASNSAFRSRLKKSDLWSTLLRLVRKLFGLQEDFDKALDQMYSIITETDKLQTIDPAQFAVMAEEEKKSPGQRKKLDLIEKVLSTFEARVKRLQAFNQKDAAKALKDDIKLLRSLTGTKRNLFVVKALAVIGKEVDQLKNTVEWLSKTDPTKLNAHLLLAVKEQLDSYKVLNQIRLELRKNPEQFVPVKEAIPELMKEFNNMFGDIQKLNEDVRNITINRVANIIKKNSNNPKLTIESIKDQLEVADRDISMMNRWFDTMADSSDEALSTLQKLIAHAYSEGDRQTNRQLYNSTPHEVDVEYKHYDEGNKVVKFKYEAVGLFKALTDYETWLKSNGKNADSLMDKFGLIINKETLQQNTNGVQFISPISPEGKKIRNIKKGDPNYPLKQFYDNYVLGYLKSQERIHLPSMRPGLRVPSIQRSLMEGILSDKGVDKVNILGQQAMDAIRRRYDENDFKAVDENGNPQEYIPIRYAARQDGKDGRLSTREVSMDVATTVGIFINEMNTYSELFKIQADAELIKNTLEQREVVKEGNRVEGYGITGVLTREHKTITDPETGLVQTIRGVESNAFKAAETGIRRLIYGQFKKDAGQVKVFGKNIDVRKSVDSFMKFTGLRILFGNLAIPFTNLGMGHLTMAKEAVGGNLINMTNWKAGQAFYGKVLKDAILDLGHRVKTTKFGRVYTYFNPADNKRPVDHIGIDTNYMRTVVPHITRGLSESTEFNLSSTALGAVFDRFKAVNSEGKEVSLYDAIEVGMDGSIKLSPGFKYKDKTTLDGKDIDEVRDYALRLYQNMNGTYNRLDSSPIKETVAGSLITFMRNWLAPGIATRYRLKHFDERLGKENEGHYISALVAFNNFYGKNGFIQGSIDSLRSLFWMSARDPQSLLLPNELGLPEEEQQKLIDMRKAGMRKTLFELYVITGLSILMFAGFDDDDQDSYALYMLARMRREMMTFISPATAWDVLRSPTVALNTIDAFNKVIHSSLNAAGAIMTGEEVKIMQQGKGKGMEEWRYRAEGFIPITSQMRQFDDLDTSVRLITKGWR